jgi:CRP/FNR family transcriptional regulator
MLIAREPSSSSNPDAAAALAMAHPATCPTNGNASCKRCAMRPCCAVNPNELARTQQMDDLVLGYRNVKKGEALFRVGDTFRNVYAVRTGSFKRLTLLADGREQVTGFYLAGESLGVDGISSGQYASDTVALEDSTVCVMPFELLELLSREVKAVQHHVYRMLSAEVVRDSGFMLLLGTMTADERVASFLLDLSRRWRQRAYSATQFMLRMTREETGSFLGLKLETVSRTLSRLQKRGLIAVQGKEVRILDFDGLTEVAHLPV